MIAPLYALDAVEISIAYSGRLRDSHLDAVGVALSFSRPLRDSSPICSRRRRDSYIFETASPLRARYLLPNFILIFLFIYYSVYCDRLDVPVMAIATYLYLGNIHRFLPRSLYI